MNVPQPGVFPTRVGVDRLRMSIATAIISFPHTRGGGPAIGVANPIEEKFSPHAWGWTTGKRLRDYAEAVFPTRVGVDQ